MVCEYKSDDCSSPLPVSYKVKMSVDPLTLWAIEAPIDVVEGYLDNAICLHCTSNNLVDGTL